MFPPSRRSITKAVCPEMQENNISVTGNEADKQMDQQMNRHAETRKSLYWNWFIPPFFAGINLTYQSNGLLLCQHLKVKNDGMCAKYAYRSFCIY